ARGIAQGRRRGAVRARGLHARRSREQGRGAGVLRAPLSWVGEPRRSDFHFRSPPPMELTFGCGFTQLSKMPAGKSVRRARRETSRAREGYIVTWDVDSSNLVAVHPRPSVHLRAHGLFERESLPLRRISGTRWS